MALCVIACAARADVALAQTHAPDHELPGDQPEAGDNDGLRVEGVQVFDPNLVALPPLLPPDGPDKLPFYSCLSAADKDMLSGTYQEALRTWREFNEEWDRYGKIDAQFRAAEERYERGMSETDRQSRDQLLDDVKRERVSYHARRKDYDQAVDNYRTWTKQIKAHCPAPAPAVTAGPPTTTPPPATKTNAPTPPATTPPPTPVVDKPAAVCPKCRHLADEIAELDTQIAKWERQTASIQKVADLKDPGIQDALKDIGKKLADLNAKKAALQKEASACEKRCTVTEETKKTNEHPIKKSAQKEKTKSKKAGKRDAAKEEEAAVPTSEQIGIAIGIGTLVGRQHHRDRDDDKRRDDDKGSRGTGLSGGISFGR